MSNQYLSLRRSLSFILSFSLAFSGVPFQAAFAEDGAVNSVTGSGGKITMEAIDPETGKPFLSQAFHSLKPGMKVHFEVKAYDAAGNDVGCKNPAFTVNQGVNEPKIKGFIGQDMIMGEGAGYADVFVRCAEVPDARAQTQVVNNTLVVPPPTTPTFGTPTPITATPITPTPITSAITTPTPAPAAPAGLSVGQQVLIGTGLGLAVVGVAVAAAAAGSSYSSSSSGSGSSCGTRAACCPSGATVCGTSLSCCPTGTTDRGICTTSGCSSAGYAGKRLCGC